MLDAELDPRLRMPRNNPYVYRSPLKRLLAQALDAMGELWLALPRTNLDWEGLKRVAVLRLDHLGDVCNAFPALQALRRRLPRATIDLFVGPWCEELANLAPGIDNVKVVQAPWFQRPQRVEWPWEAIIDLGLEIRSGHYDLAIDLRGELRHHLAMAYAGVPRRLGHAITAGKFLLTHPGRYHPTLHEIDQNLSLIGARLGARPVLRISADARVEACRAMRTLRIRPGFIAIQASCGTSAKAWPEARWMELLRRLPRTRPVVMLGASADRDAMERIRKGAKAPRVHLLAGKLSLGGLSALLGEAGLLVSLDTGPAHLAAAMGTPILGLYSGTNLLEQWGIRGKRVRILRQEVPCAPCGLSVCPYGNECMKRIQVEDVLRAIAEFR